MLHAPTPLPTSSSRSPVDAAPAAGDAGATDHLHSASNPAQRAELDRWLRDAKMPSGTMDLMTLEGFLTAIVVGPTTCATEDWLPRVWGARRPDRRAPACLQEPVAYARFRELVLRYHAEIAEQFDTAPESFQPTFCSARFDGVETIIVDPWCIGFVARMNMQLRRWRPLQRECPDLLRPLLLYGTHPGWEERHKVRDPAAFHAEWRPQIAPAVHGIHRYWLGRNSSICELQTGSA